MEIDDRLAKDGKREAEAAAREPYYAAEPDWMIYMERERKPWLNRDMGVFEVTDKVSLNKAPSVFEATAVFDTGGKNINGSQI